MVWYNKKGSHLSVCKNEKVVYVKARSHKITERSKTYRKKIRCRQACVAGMNEWVHWDRLFSFLVLIKMFWFKILWCNPALLVVFHQNKHGIQLFVFCSFPRFTTTSENCQIKWWNRWPNLRCGHVTRCNFLKYQSFLNNKGFEERFEKV